MKTEPILHEIFTKRATEEADCFVLDIDITDMDGERYRCFYVTRPGDAHGLNPLLQQWITDNPAYPVQPYVAPTADELRRYMPILNAAEVRFAMLKNGVALTVMDTAIAALPDGLTKQIREVQWKFKPSFTRLHPLMEMLRVALGLTPEQFDAEWAEAVGDPEE